MVIHLLPLANLLAVIAGLTRNPLSIAARYWDCGQARNNEMD